MKLEPHKIVWCSCLMWLLCFNLVSCQNAKDEKSLKAIDAKESLIEADYGFSKECETKGYREAYLHFLDTTGVLLRPDEMPLQGSDAVSYLFSTESSGYTMKWEPYNAFIAESGDMGYTYGVYSIRPHDVDTSFLGNYVSVWRKQKNGQWKVVLHSGNTGVGIQYQ